MSTTSLKDLLVEREILTPQQIAEATAAAQGTGCTWIERLLFLGLLDEEGLANWVSALSLVATCDARRLTHVHASVLARIPLEIAFDHRAVPFHVDQDGYLHVAMVDPLDSVALDEIAFFAGLPLLRHVAPASVVAWALYSHYGVRSILWPRTEAVAVAAR